MKWGKERIRKRENIKNTGNKRWQERTPAREKSEER